MADQSDVEQALAAIVAGVLYPAGVAAPGLLATPASVHRGWPVPATLDADLAAGRITVAVAADQTGQRTTTRYPDEWRSLATSPPTFGITITGNVAVVSGSADSGQLVGLQVGHVAGVHRTVAGDTPASVAAALARALAPSAGVTASGAVMTAPAGSMLVGRVVADQPSLRETRRQLQAFRVGCFCPDPGTRDQVVAAVDQAFSAIDFIGLPDGMAGRVRFLGTHANDRAQAAHLYRRDLVYSVDYATTIAADLPRMLFGDTRVAGNGVLVKTILS